MTKAKIVLSAVALFAVVGGALAFKAHRAQPGTVFRTTLVGGNVVCNTTSYLTQDNDENPVITSYYTSKNALGICQGLTTSLVYPIPNE